jgi:hypothetical protein
MAVDLGHTLLVKCLIKEGGADIEAMLTPSNPTYIFMGNPTHTVLSTAATMGNYPLVQWLIEEGALIPACISHFLKTFFNTERANAAELSSLLKVLMLQLMSPNQDRDLSAFVAQLSPQHAEICTRGRQLRDRLPAYLEQQEASVGTHCPLPAVLQAIVTAYALPTPEDLWRDGLQ